MTRLVSLLSVVAIGGLVVTLARLNVPAPPIAPDRMQWSTFADLQRPRAFANAIALPTGEILVLGGLDRADEKVTNPSTELIDPLAGKVHLLPQTILARLHQSVALAGGTQVVVAGGVVWATTKWSPVARVDIYDAERKTWRSGAPLQHPRSDHAAVTLKDGRVMVIGGNFDTTLLSSVEIYDARTDTWTDAPPMPRARTQHTAVVLRDGRVLVAGGIDSDGGATDTTLVYDPRTNTWADGPRMLQPRLQESAVLLRSGDVLFAGGDGAAADSSEIFRATEDRFVPSGYLVHPRFVAQAALMLDGRVVLNGGLPPHGNGYVPLATTEIWDPRTGDWSEVPSASSPRAWGKLVVVDGDVFLVSGTGIDESAVSSIERLTFK